MAVGRFRPDARVAILAEDQTTTGFFAFGRRGLITPDLRPDLARPLIADACTPWQSLINTARRLDCCHYASGMLLSGALLALFMTGFWLYGLTDVILTPAATCRGLSKTAWIAVIAVTFIGGAFAWVIVRRPVREPVQISVPRPGNPDEYDDAGDAAPHQAAPAGPDDDREFLRALEADIRRNPPVS
jgi:hypothetical protein